MMFRKWLNNLLYDYSKEKKNNEYINFILHGFSKMLINYPLLEIIM